MAPPPKPPISCLLYDELIHQRRASHVSLSAGATGACEQEIGGKTGAGKKEKARLAAISAFLAITIKGMERFEKIFDEERLTIVGDGGTCQVKSSHSDASYSTAMIFSLASNTDIRGGAPVVTITLTGKADGTAVLHGKAKLNIGSTYEPSQLGYKDDLKLASPTFEHDVKQYLCELYIHAFEFIEKYTLAK